MLKTRISNLAKITAVNSYCEGQNIRTVAGLPVRAAVVHASLFVAAFWFYSALWTIAPVGKPDSGGYLRAAQALSYFPIDRLQDRAPGYPLFLLLTGSTQSLNRNSFFVSLLLHFASIWLLASVLRRAGVRESMLILFGFILLLPPYVECAGYIMSENLAELMLVAAFVSFVLWHTNKATIWLVISALTTGYAGLTRPTYQVLGFAMAGYLLLTHFLLPWTPLRRRDMIKASFILMSGSLLIVGGYAFFNYLSFGYFVVTPKFGLTLSTKTARVIERLPDEEATIKETLIRGRNEELVSSQEHTGYMYIWSTLPQLQKITGFDQPQLSDYMLRLNLLLIQKAPLTYLEEVIWAFGSYWLPSSGELANFNSRSLQLLWGILHFCLLGGFAFNMILLVGAATYIKMYMRLLPIGDPQPVGEMRSIQLQGFMYGLAGTMVFYTPVVSCLIEAGDPRYRAPTDALIIFMLFLGTDLWQRLVDISRIVFCNTEPASHESSGCSNRAAADHSTISHFAR